MVSAREFMVTLGDGKTIPLLSAPLKASNMDEFADDPDKTEQVVRVDWLREVPREEAYWEKALFAKQHWACRLRNRFTIEKVTEHFGLTD